MNVLRKITAAILAAAMIVSACVNVFAAPADIPYEERVFELTEEKTAEVNAAMDSFKSALKKKNNWDGVMEEYNSLLELYMEIGTIKGLADTEQTKLNYGIESDYTLEETSETIDAASRLAKDVRLAVKSALDSQYADNFREHWGEWRTEGIESITDEYDATRLEFSKRYYEILNDDKMTDEEKSVKESESLVEIVEYGNRVAQEEYGFDNYIERLYDGTGYDVQDVTNFLQVLQGYSAYVNKFRNYITHEVLSESSDVIRFSSEEMLQKLGVVGNIDPRMADAYEYLIRNNLFCANTNGNHVGYTIYYPKYGDSGIVVSGEGTMRSPIHEFGHYFSSLNEEISPEDYLFFDGGEFAEFDSQIMELMALEHYGDIYGDRAKEQQAIILLTVLTSMDSCIAATAAEIAIYSGGMNAEEIRIAMEQTFGSQWYTNQQFFVSVGNQISYPLAMVDVLQVFDLYLKDKDAGIEKCFEVMSTNEVTDENYIELNERYGLISAFDDNVYEVMTEATNNIFKYFFDIDYDTALDYFENKTYLGNVFPTAQKVSVDGGEPQTLYAYNSNGYNYIKIRDLAMLLKNTDAAFNVTWDEETYTVNIITGEEYTPTGTEMGEIPEVVTAGMKAAGTGHLTLDGEETNYARAIFVNGWNCYQLRGLAENKILPIGVDYDEETNTVLITTK